MNLDLPDSAIAPQGKGEAAQAASPAHGVYAQWAPRYRAAGFWPLPITPGTKTCNVPSWQYGMSDQQFEESLRNFPCHGIGLLLGSSFPDGTTLAAVDIDDDHYTKIVSALIGELACAREGSKGLGAFVRCKGPVKTRRYRFENRSPHVELLCSGSYIVIPPTTHGLIHRPYRWLTTPLLEFHYDQLPLIEA
jgi:hypothetical protein